MSYKLTISGGTVLEKCIQDDQFNVFIPNDNIFTAKCNNKNLVRITGYIDTEESTVALYEWALTPATNPDCYKEITIEHYKSERLLRRVTFPKAFVVKYSECYSNDEGVGSFTLYIKQLYGQDIEVTSEALSVIYEEENLAAPEMEEEPQNETVVKQDQNTANPMYKRMEEVKPQVEMSTPNRGIIYEVNKATEFEKLKNIFEFRTRSLELAEDPARGQQLIKEGIGGARYELATGRKIIRSIDSAVDFIDPVIGEIDLKGPLLANDGSKIEITNKMVTGLAKSIIHEANMSTISKAVVVDTLNMTEKQISMLQEIVSNGVKTDKLIIYIK